MKLVIHNPETIDRLLIANSRFPSTRVLLRLVEEVLNLDKPFGDWRPDNLGVPTIGGSFYRCISIVEIMEMVPMAFGSPQKTPL